MLETSGRMVFLLIVCLALASPALAEDPPVETILFPSGYSLSPDGTTLLFSWHGDVWRASATGGDATRLTTTPANDRQPHLSPDGKSIAFISNRTGHDHIWLMPVKGGLPTRLTTHTEAHRIEDFFPDGRALLVRQSRDHAWRRADRLWRRPLEVDAKPELLFDDYAYSAVVSPDGTRVAFAREGTGRYRKQYRGSQASQVWIYDIEKKTFRKITEGDHEERHPLWAPDGEHLYLTSQEGGTFNLYRHDLRSGEREQLTRFEDDGLHAPALAADGSVIVFQRLGQTWRMTPQDGEPHVIELHNPGDRTTDTELRRVLKAATGLSFTDDAREIAFVAGGDLYVMDTELREPKRVTDTADEEREPIFSPDHQSLYFIRDKDGQPDIWVAQRGDVERHWWQNDAFELERLTDDADSEWALWLTPKGERLSFIRGRGELWTMKPDGSDKVQLVDSWNSPWYSFSPDGRWVAYALDDENFNSDVWIKKADGTGEPFNLSRHPDRDSNPAFSPDGKLLAFTSKRAGDDMDIHYVWLRQQDEDRSKRDRTLEKAVEAMKGRKKKRKKKAAPKLTPTEAPKAVEGDAFVGTWVGSIQSEDIPAPGMTLTIVVTKAEDGAYDVTVQVPDAFDGKPEVVEVEGDRIRLVLVTPLGRLEVESRVQGEKMTGTWKLDTGMTGTHELERQKPPAKPTEKEEKKEKKEPAKKAETLVEIDFEGLEDRLHRISIPNSSERGLMWSPDSKKLAFQASVGGKSGLYTVSIPDAEKPKLLTTIRGRAPRWLPEAKKIGWLVGGTPATLDASGKAKSFGFEVRQVTDVGARHAAAFDQAWRVIGDSFYDPGLNGRDWAAIRAKYRPLAAQALTASELDAVIEMMLGELNGSHLGFGARGGSWSAPGWREETGHLGLRFDETWPGPGLQVGQVIPEMPAARSQHRIEPGEIVLAIDGQAVDPGMNLARILTGDPKRQVALRVRATDGTEREVRMQPTSYRRVRTKLYALWLEHNRKLVGELSDERFGYLHVRGMNWSSFRNFEEALYRAGYGKDGLVIDVRNNGGGFTADHLLTALTQPSHAFTVARDGKPGYPQDRMVYARWTKPIVVLTNQNSFSNAEIFAHAVRTLGRGKVVGVPTAGGVISTGSTEIMDIGYLRLPFRGWFGLPNGEDMERRGCPVDVLVWPQPGELPSGKDRQIEAAVEVLKKDVEAWAKRPSPKPRYAAER